MPNHSYAKSLKSQLCQITKMLNHKYAKSQLYQITKIITMPNHATKAKLVPPVITIVLTKPYPGENIWSLQKCCHLLLPNG